MNNKIQFELAGISKDQCIYLYNCYKIYFWGTTIFHKCSKPASNMFFFTFGFAKFHSKSNKDSQYQENSIFCHTLNQESFEPLIGKMWKRGAMEAIIMDE